MTGGVTSTETGSRPEAAWLLLVLYALLIVVVVLIIIWACRGSRKRVIVTFGCIAGAISLVAVGIAVSAAGRHRKAAAWKANLTRLGFPLELPHVPGYYPMAALTGPGSLDIGLGRSGPVAGVRSSVMTVTLYRTVNSEGADYLGICERAGASRTVDSQLTCDSLGSGLWRVMPKGLDSMEILVRTPYEIVVVRQEQYASLPDSVLLRTARSLRPATADQVAAIPLTNASGGGS